MHRCGCLLYTSACTAFVPASVALVSMPDGTNAVKVDAMETDPGFWKVFRMQFVAGRGLMIPTGVAMCPPLSWLLLWRGDCSARRMHLTEMRGELSPDETELLALTDSTLTKLRAMTDAEFDALELYPDFDE